MVLENVSGAGKVDDPDPRWDDVVRDLTSAEKLAPDTQARERMVADQVGSIVSSKIQTRTRDKSEGVFKEEEFF